jgi:hypothetical protein
MSESGDRPGRWSGTRLDETDPLPGFVVGSRRTTGCRRTLWAVQSSKRSSSSSASSIQQVGIVYPSSVAKVCPERWAQAVTDFLCDLDESKTQAPQNINAFTIIPPMNNGKGSVIRTWSPIPREKRKKRAPGKNNARATTRSKYPDNRFMANIVPQSASVRRPGDACSRSIAANAAIREQNERSAPWPTRCKRIP